MTAAAVAAAAAAPPTNAPAATPPAAVATTPATPAAPAAPAPKPTASAPPAALATAATISTNAPALSESWIPGWLSGAWTNWHGNVQFGANMGLGTTDRYSIFANASASKKWGRTTSLVNYNINYGVVNDVVNANRMGGGTKVDVELNQDRRLYTYGQGNAGYDRIRQISLEYTMGAGMGYRFLNRPRLVLAGELGSQYQVFNYFSSPDRENVAARLAENITTKVGKDVSIIQTLGFTPGIQDLSDYQIRFGFTLSLPLFKPLTLNLNVINEYDSQPAPGVSNNDLQLSTTIGVNF
jgi:putative salt-induced outer membrane protein YdiY